MSRTARWAAAGVCVGALALPLVFVPVARDAFVGPRMVVLLVLSCALVACIPPLLRGRAVTRPAALDLLVACLVLWTAATILSADPLHSLVGEPYQYQGLLATLAYGVAFAAGYLAVRGEAALQAFAGALVVAGTVAAFYALVQSLGLDPIWRGELDRGRVFSTLGQANALAAFLVLALPFACAAAIGRTRWVRVAGLAATALMAAALVASLSRGGYLGLAAAGLTGFALWGIRRRDFRSHFRPPAEGAPDGGDAVGESRPTGAGTARRRAGVIVAIALAGLATAALLFAVDSPISRRLLVAIDPTESSAHSHLDTWAVGARIALENPLLGIGPEMYPRAFASYRDRVLPPDRAAVLARFRPESPHDVPIAIAAAAGIPALVLYLALIGVSLASGLRRYRRASPAIAILLGAAVAAVAGHLVTDLFMTAEPAGAWVFWATLGLLAAPALADYVDGPVIRTRPATHGDARS